MAGTSSKSSAPKARKRVEAEISSLKRARDGSAFTRCEECNKDVPVVLIDMHSCSLDSKIKMHLESQIVEKTAEPKKPVERKRVAPSEKKAKKEKNPNAPKRPATAFFLFMSDFRKEFAAANPDNKKVSLVAKEGGMKWKSLSKEEKQPYFDKAEELKAEFEKSKADRKTEDEVEVIEDDEENGDDEDKDKEDAEEKEDVVAEVDE